MTAPKALPKTAKARVQRRISREESVVVRMWMFRALKLLGVVKSWISRISSSVGEGLKRGRGG